VLATGSGTFGAAEVRRLFAGVLEDQEVYRAETAAVLVSYVAVHPRADADARRRFADLAANARIDDPDLEPWIAKSFSAPLLQRAAALIAGRGRQHKVARKDILDLMNAAYHGGSGPSPRISPDEGLAFLVIRELFDGRLAADAQKALDDVCAAVREDGHSIGPSQSSSGGTAPGTGSGTRQCGACVGMGSVTCSSCGGLGYHIRSGSRTRPDGSTEYYQEHIPCRCTGGRVGCGRCGGSGRV
jgi:hypothetical protein